MTDPDDPNPWLAQARLHESSGRLVEAVAAYEQALRRQAALPNSWYNLARLQRR